MSSAATSQERPPVPLEISALPSLADMGFSGGRDSFRSFVANVFASESPRFLRTDENALVVFRHADLRAFGALADVGNVPPAMLAARRPADATPEEAPPGSAIADVLSNQVFFANPPIHGPIRRLLLNQIGPKGTSALEPVARAVTRDILDGQAGKEILDLVSDIAEPLAVRFWATLLSMTEAEMADMSAIVPALTPLLFLKRDKAEARQLDVALRRYGDLVEAAALRSLAEGRHPMVTAMAAELAGIQLDDDPELSGIVPKNVGKLLAGNLFDGFHTAALGAANTFYALMRYPEASAQIKASPDLLPTAISEALRLEPPVITLNRLALADVEYDGMLIRKGTSVAMFWGAGNLDPAAFPNPMTFDLSRSHQGLTTFGGGSHICPGRFAATMLTRVMLEAFAERNLVAEPIEGETWIQGHTMSQLATLPARVRVVETG
jgi:cytochrome P450